MKHSVCLRIRSGLPIGALARRDSLTTPVRRFALPLVLGLLSCIGLPFSDAQLTILHSFGDGTVKNDGIIPGTGLIQAPDGNFYGSTAHSTQSIDGSGTIYRMTPAGVVTIVNTFRLRSDKRAAADFLYYNGELVAPVNTRRRPSTVVATKLSGKMTTWHKFLPSDGASPEGSLIVGSDGNLYGTCYGGGANTDGTIYKINPTSPFAFTVVYNFSSLSTGVRPVAGLLLAQDGNYYGTTETGTTGGGAGTVFRMTPAGQVKFVLQFPGVTDYCDAPLIQDKAGNFYGVTIDGGTYGGGYAFKLSPTFQMTVLHQFGNGKDGNWPNSVVFGPNGNLYGTTEFGGPADDGIVFEVSTDGLSYTVLHKFGDGTVANDGNGPLAGLTLGSDNNLYGTTSFGGSAGYGTIFRITP